RHLLAVDDDGAGAVDDGIHVLGSVVCVVVPDGLPTGWKLHLIEPEGADAEGLADALVVRTRGRVRSWGRFQRGCIDRRVSHPVLLPAEQAAPRTGAFCVPPA